MYKEGMTKEFITSDTHFGHKNILKFSPKTRPYSSIDEMDEAIIREWNKTVSPRDVVYILGDVSYREPSHTARIFDRLNGNKILVAGNHDEKALKQKRFRDCFNEIHQYLEITHEKHKVVMFHYPIAEWNKCSKGSIHLHGHMHGSPTGLEGFRALDVGIDATGQVVVTLEWAVNKALKGKIKAHHGD